MILIEEGPTSVLVIARSSDKKRPDVDALQSLIRRLLGELREVLPLMRLKASLIKNTKHLPWIAKEMVEACYMVDPEELTPMAAVAGAISDAIKERLVEEGFEYVVVNNGGDTSIFTSLDQVMKVGLAGIDGGMRAFLKVPGPLNLGIATSGLGGRSLTKGIADAATVVAKKGSIADAAATYVGNAACLDSPHILKRSAEDLDMLTDLKGQLVCTGLLPLREEEVLEAETKALATLARLQKEGIVEGGVLNIQGRISTLFSNDKYVTEVRDVNKKDCDHC